MNHRSRLWLCGSLFALATLGTGHSLTAQIGALGNVGGAQAGIGQAAQMDFSGDWGLVRNQDNTEEPVFGDWMGIPLNDAGWARAAAWDPDIDSLPPWQCRPQSWSYVYRALQTMRITKEIDPVSRDLIGFRVRWQFTPETVIYLDGRPHPPDVAPHSWMGFSTATWEGDILKITTTHLKDTFIKRNGVFASDRRTETTYWIRRGDLLTWISVGHDPVYLSEPLIRSGEFRLTRGLSFGLYSCTPADEGTKKGYVPAFFPDANPYLHEAAAQMNVSDDVLRAGASAMYPEFQLRLRSR
jgi:hypothetical protein